MKNLLRLLLVALASIAGLLEVSAQALWGTAQLGMTPAEVLRRYPDAELPSDGKALPGDRQEMLRMPFMAMVDTPSTVHFYFQSERLHTVAWRISPQGDFSSFLPRYEGFLQGVMREHPVSRDLETKRQLNMNRFLSDNWTTAEDVRISMTLFDSSASIPVRLGMSASGDGGAWSRLEAREGHIRQQEQNAQQLAKIKRRKAEEERSYGQFLEGWVGKDIGKLASKWGAPTGTTRLPNGEIIYVWDSRSDDWQCRTSIFTRNSGKITKWQWSGNNCRIAK